MPSRRLLTRLSTQLTDKYIVNKRDRNTRSVDQPDIHVQKVVRVLAARSLLHGRGHSTKALIGFKLYVGFIEIELMEMP